MNGEPREDQAGTRLRLLWWILLLSALAALADWFAPPIFFHHSLVLGVVFYWIGLRRFGRIPALPVLIVSTAILTLKWGQPYSALLVTLEGLWVGWLWGRGRNPLLVCLLYWAVLGTPASWFLYTHVYLIPHPAFEQALGVQVVNGLIAVWLALVINGLVPGVGSRSAPGELDSFRAFLIKRYVAFGTIPLLAAGLLAARIYEEDAVEEANNRLSTSAQLIAAEVNQYVANGLFVVNDLALRTSAPTGFGSTEQLEADLVSAQASSTFFVTMLAADPRGIIVAAAPRPMPDGRQPAIRPDSVADRQYFAVPIKTNKPYVSDAFLGRSFGSDVLVAISSPVTTRGGERLGIIEGSMRVSDLEAILRRNLPNASWRMLLTDRQMRVISAVGADSPPLSPLAGTPLGRLIHKAAGKPSRFSAEVGTERSSFLSVSVPVPGLEWTFTLQRSWGDVIGPVISVYGVVLGVALAAVLVAVLFTTWSIHDFLSAWNTLIAFAQNPISSDADLERTSRLDLPREFHDLFHNLSAMAKRLASAQSQREQLLHELEDRVQSRTLELQKALVAAQAADRAKSAFLATMSHELRTPLTAIITGTSLLRMAHTDKSALEMRTLSTLEKSGQVLISVISDVLDYSKLEAEGVTIQHGPFRPAELLSDVATILTPAASQAGLTLSCDVRHAPDLEWSGDRARLRQVLINLAGNAIKFTAEGFVKISSSVAEATPTAPRRLCFVVQDSGRGIPEEKLAAIFEPFVQLESERVKSQAGTGLGLTISRKLVQMMGGGLTVASRLGEGATFAFWIPENGSTGPASPI